MTRTTTLAILAAGLLASGCASAPRATTPAAPTFDQSLAWIIRLEDQRMLRGGGAARTASGGHRAAERRGAAPRRAPRVPDLLAALSDRDPRVRRRAALAVGRVGLAEGIVPLTRVLSSDAIPKCGRWPRSRLG